MLIFVYEPVLTLLPVWEKNAGADFTPTVDSPDIFAFVKEIKQEQKWVFPFQYASQISTVLKIQLSILLRFLLEKKRGKNLDHLAFFSGESRRAQQVALEQPPLWEYMLTEELLRKRFEKIHRSYEDLKKGFVLRVHRRLTGPEFLRWVGGKLSDLSTIVPMIKGAVTEDLVEAWGRPGANGDALQILGAVNRLETGCAALMEWEGDVFSVEPPSGLAPLKVEMLGATEEIFSELHPLPEKLEEIVKKGLLHKGPEPLVCNLELVFRFSRADRICAVMKELEGHPDWHN